LSPGVIEGVELARGPNLGRSFTYLDELIAFESDENGVDRPLDHLRKTKRVELAGYLVAIALPPVYELKDAALQHSL
jgi:hypothetical protein